MVCVFDKDDFKDIDFNNAIKIAKANSYEVAYSNQAFEYWIILHFDDHQGGGMHRNDYNDKINTLIKPHNIFYDGKNSKLISEDFFNLLDGIDENTEKERKLLAIERAKRNFNRNNHDTPAKAESSTTVFRLVEEIVKYIKNIQLNTACFFTNYSDYTKASASYNGTGVAGSDIFSRNNKVFAVGIDFSF